MIFAHRANIDGPTSLYYENSETAILECIEKGFGVEIDIWVKKGKIYLGHDDDYLREVCISFLEKYADKLLIHCKNKKAINFMWPKGAQFHFFTHLQDNYAFTNRGHLISFCDKIPKIDAHVGHCIVMMPEMFSGLEVPQGYSVCTDYPDKYV